MMKFKKHNILNDIVLAIASMFLIIGFIFMTPNVKLYDTYYTPYEKIIDKRNIDVKVDSIQIAFDYVENKDYDNAINIFEEIIHKNNDNVLAHFYLGSIYQEMGNYKDAVKEYEIVSKTDNLLVEQANWYSALCYLKFNRQKAYNKFYEISKKEGFYQSLSNKILLAFNINKKIVNLLFFFIIMGLILFVYFRQAKIEKVSKQLIEFLNRNIEFLNEVNKKQEIQEIKNIINLFSQCQVICKVANCDYVSFFKYDYSKRYISLNFMLSVDKNGTMIHNSLLYEMGNDILTLDLKFNYDDLYFKNIENVIDTNVAYVMKKNDISKFYYQNIYKEDLNTPIGFIALSFKDDKYIIPNEDKVEIIRMIEKIKYFL